MAPERAKEIIEAGRQWSNCSKHCTPAEDAEVRDKWQTMPGYTCWHDALLRFAYPERTTAEYRKLAREAASRLEWGTAADCWQAAIDNYPSVCNRSGGALEQRDKKLMAAKRDACLSQYFPS